METWFWVVFTVICGFGGVLRLGRPGRGRVIGGVLLLCFAAAGVLHLFS